MISYHPIVYAWHYVFTTSGDPIWNGGMNKYYSPQIDRDLVSALYHEAKARGIPMTRLASDLIRAALHEKDRRGHTPAVAKAKERYERLDACERACRVINGTPSFRQRA